MARNERELTIHVPLKDCVDSMLLDSDQEVATYELTDADGGGVVSVQVLGAVSVEFDGEHYTKASQMPDELLEIFREGKLWTDEGMVEDEDADEDFYVSHNNWFEAILFRDGSDGGNTFLVYGWRSEDELRNALDARIEELGWAQHE